MRKRYRIYFNRAREWPQCWSIDEGEQATEINVCGFQINDCEVTSCALTPALRAEGRADDQPFAWLEVTGILSIMGGHAVIG